MSFKSGHNTSKIRRQSIELSLTKLNLPLPKQDNIAVAIERDGDAETMEIIKPESAPISPISKLEPIIEPTKPHKKSHKKSRKKKHKNRKKRRKSDKNASFSPISQIEIYDTICDDDILTRSTHESHTPHSKKMEEESDFNSQIIRKTKRPFYILIFISVLNAGILVMNFTNILKQFLFSGLTPSIASIVSMIPLYLCFKYFENNLIFQSEIIYKKIMETYSLQKKLQSKTDAHLVQKRYIDDLKQLIKEQQIQIDKLSMELNKDCTETVNITPIDHKLNLLHGFRKGQMEIQIEFADTNELIQMLNIVVSCITSLPFGMTNYRTKLKRILEAKIEKNKYLQMHFYFFLLSYLECTDVKRLFRKHKIMKKVKNISQFYNKCQKDLSETSECKSETLTDKDCGSVTPFGKHNIGNNTPYNYNQNNDEMANEDKLLPTYNIVDIKRLSMNNSDALPNIVYFKEKDPIKLFRAPLDHFAKVGFTVIIPPELQHRFYDPINGNHCIQQLKVRSIFNSNAKPYLIDCYVKNDGINSSKRKRKRKKLENSTPVSAVSQRSQSFSMVSPLLLSSSFILKKSDDLRKDQAVLQMFQFMNSIWKENDIAYFEKYSVSCLIYKVVPFGTDIGIIELISNCIELNKIMSLKTTLFTAHCGDNNKVTAKFRRLIASSAGSFIGSFVCGIRDRHDDNILVNVNKCILFHIDYGYIFNNKVSLDTAKFAITSDLKKIFELYKNGWNDFVKLCVDAWMVLRVNANELIDYARVVFAFLYNANEIELFLRDSLKLDMTNSEAQKYISNKIQNAPKQWKTKMKNLVHGFAQKMRTTSQSNVLKSVENNISEQIYHDV